MISHKLNIAVILTLIGSINAIPDNLFCCSADMGVFKYFSLSNASCWNEKFMKTSFIRLTCDTYIVFLSKYLKLTVTETGRVFFSHPQLEEPQEINHGEVCFANYTDSNKIKQVTVLCADEVEDERVLGYCMGFSTVFLLLTSVVYAALPEVRDLQGKSFINFCASMGMGLGIMAGAKFISYTSRTICAIQGFTIYFFVMAAFFWLNAISVQMLISLRRPVVNNYSWKEFAWYALYAWGCPALLSICMAIVNYWPGDHKKPGIGLNNCWFSNTRQQWYYMYSVMAVLITVNICIFIYMSVHIWRLSFWSSQTKALRYKFVVTLRMFVIMGVTWIFEMISSVTEHSVMWFTIDMFNTLQGPLVFLMLVVFRKRVLKALLKRGWLSCAAGPVERYLAVKEDDEEEVIQHNIDVTMNDRNGLGANDI